MSFSRPLPTLISSTFIFAVPKCRAWHIEALVREGPKTQQNLPELKSNENQRKGSGTHNQERENNSLQLLPRLSGICIRDLENDCHLIKQSTLEVSPYVGLGNKRFSLAGLQRCLQSSSRWPSLPDSGCILPWVRCGREERETKVSVLPLIKAWELRCWIFLAESKRHSLLLPCPTALKIAVPGRRGEAPPLLGVGVGGSADPGP